jgi:rhodanese-related sulfurtransferase
MHQVTAPQLHEWLADPARQKPVLLDVREPWELEKCAIAGVMSMPMRTVPVRFQELDREADVVVICHHGARSYQVAAFLEQQGFANIHNLYGGVAAWAQQVDPTMPTY